jgi:hypothetical protein
MPVAMVVERMNEIHRRRKRQEKIQKLRERYAASSSSVDKGRILEKLKRISPWMTKEEFLAPLQR